MTLPTIEIEGPVVEMSAVFENPYSEETSLDQTTSSQVGFHPNNDDSQLRSPSSDEEEGKEKKSPEDKKKLGHYWRSVEEQGTSLPYVFSMSLRYISFQYIPSICPFDMSTMCPQNLLKAQTFRRQYVIPSRPFLCYYRRSFSHVRGSLLHSRPCSTIVSSSSRSFAH